ncbi:MAG: hypothetical protein HY902_00585 [Deltaproteobacteria bacterium]|nr:hypothetical protein [Deltaproteobacteria bacterium]
MRLSDLAANLTFWSASPALAWYLARHRGWSWFAALPAGLLTATVLALVVAAAIGAISNNRSSN